VTTLAVLCYVVRGGRVLLIEKRRGFGAGKLNAPGGRVEPGESPERAAVRECEEETGLRPSRLRRAGVLEFYSRGGEPDWVVHVFVASDFSGEARPSDEAVPRWYPVSALPYDRMWEDDRHWLPYVLAGGVVRARFGYDPSYSRLLWYSVEFRASGAPLRR